MRYRTAFGLAGPFVTWALCFLALYAAQFVGCAWGWDVRSYAGVSLLRFVLIGLLALSLFLLVIWWKKLKRRRTEENDVLSAITHVAALAALAATVFVFPGVFWLSVC
ncbi:hypothetical protein ACFVTJ_17030 [Agrobacterium sp. NPDC058088]|uniref:hypothetical protein n=1 Tax=Agrobacterium sp. NPDC058088 TaxID=3346335 RepID=UPI0036DA84BD